MGWFTGGWFVEGWFLESASTSALISPAMISAVTSAPVASLKLGQRKTAVLQGMLITSPGVKNSAGSRPTAAVLPLISGFSYVTKVKTGVKIQTQSIPGRFGINAIAAKAGCKFLAGCSSLSTRLENIPLLAAGIRQNVIPLSILTLLPGNQIKTGVTLSAAVINLIAGQKIPNVRRGMKISALSYCMTGSVNNVMIKTSIKFNAIFLKLLVKLLEAKGGSLKGALPIVIPITMKYVENVQINSSDHLISLNNNEYLIVLHEGEY